MLHKFWEATPIPHDDGSLFEAIVTAEDGRQLIAQCTTLDFAKDIKDKHNRFDIELAQLNTIVLRQERQIKAARDRIVDLKDVIDGVVTTAGYTAGVFSITPRMYDELQQALDDEGWYIAWLAANAPGANDNSDKHPSGSDL